MPALRRGAPATSFKVRGRNLKVDLLVPSDAKPFAAIPLPELGAHATGLPHLRYLLEVPAFSILIGRDRLVPVAVPDAGRFCIHKLAVYSLRGGSDHPKREKDVFQAALLAAVLWGEHEQLLADAIAAMSRPLRAKARAGARRAAAILSAQFPEAADALAALD